jgi:glycosyltransferase involved in cell wall biosynthesis
MKLLYVSSKKNWGGVVSWQVRTAQELEKRGHTVWIFSSRKSALTREAPPDLRLIPVKFGMDYNPLLILRFVRFIRRHRIDAVAFNIKKELIAGGIAARICGIPTVRFIGNENDFQRIRSLQLRLADRNVVPCEHTKRLILEQYPWVPESSLSVIHIGRNTERFPDEAVAAQRAAWGLTREHLVIGVTGRLVEAKGPGFLIRAFSRVAALSRGTVLVVSGAGKDRGSFEALARDLRLEGKVIFAGFVENTGLAAAAYDIAVLPSDYEGFPYALVEYMSAGTAVISTDVGGTREIVEDGKNGFLIEPRNEDQLAARLETLIRRPELRREFGRAAGETVRGRFSEDLMIDRFIELYGEMIRH